VCEVLLKPVFSRASFYLNVHKECGPFLNDYKSLLKIFNVDIDKLMEHRTNERLIISIVSVLLLMCLEILKKVTAVYEDQYKKLNPFYFPILLFFYLFFPVSFSFW
jgi:hypothetical protein